MSPAAVVLGESRDLALAGPPDPRPEQAEAFVALGSAALPEEVAPERSVRLLRGAAPEGASERLIAQAGDAAWRRSPWPAADALFELAAPLAGDALVVDFRPERLEVLGRLLGERALPARLERALTIERLKSAAVVIFPTFPGEPLPAEAMQVLAARRVLVTGLCEPSFGLISEVDWFPGEREDDLVQYAEAALRSPRAFELPRAMGALAARPHRASLAYARLAGELALGA